MNATIELYHGTPGKPPLIVLHGDGMSLSLSFTEWQEVVHRASWLYVRWAAQHDVDLVDADDGIAAARKRAGFPPIARGELG